jgi:deoxycytidylate deaminase/intein/homing endonuclease
MRRNSRPSKDEYYLEISKAVCLRSPCIRRQFGAIIVKDDVVVATGYNGSPRGVVNCTEVGCLKDELDLPHYSGYDYCVGVHAEENCVSENALTILPDGEVRPLKDTHSRLLAFDTLNFEIIPSDGLRFDKYEDKIIKIRTTGNNEIEVSPNHLMFVMDDRNILSIKKACELTTDDYLPIVTKLDIGGSPQKLPDVPFDSYYLTNEGVKMFRSLREEKKLTWNSLAKRCGFSTQVISRLIHERGIRIKNKEMMSKIFPQLEPFWVGLDARGGLRLPAITSPEFCQIIGYFIGDGSLSRNYVAFHDENKETLDFYNNMCKKTFGISEHTSIKNSAKGSHHVLIICSHRLWALFKKLGFGTRKNKRIPPLFHKVDEPSLSSLLRGLFDAEGTVGERAIHLTSGSKSLLETVKYLLLRFGIMSSIYTIKRGRNGFAKGKYYSLEICGLDLDTFREKVNFNHPIKRTKLTSIKKRFFSKRMYPKKCFKGIPTTGFSHLRDDGKVFTGMYAKRVLNKFDELNIQTELLPKLRKLVNKIGFVKIKKLKRVKKRAKMIDFFVPNYNTFIANGFIVHNCIINAARHGASVLGGTMYLYGQKFGDSSPIEGRPCDRCKRAIINAGIKEVVTKKSDGSIVKTDVGVWVKEDTKQYLDKLEEARKAKKTK